MKVWIVVIVLFVFDSWWDSFDLVVVECVTRTIDKSERG